MRQNSLALGLAVVMGLPTGWIGSMLLTPVLWRLEAILPIELAGHSGPSDWVFFAVWAVVIPIWFLLFRFIVCSRHS